MKMLPPEIRDGGSSVSVHAVCVPTQRNRALV
jgi:hypothetical protein